MNNVNGLSVKIKDKNNINDFYKISEKYIK